MQKDPRVIEAISAFPRRMKLLEIEGLEVRYGGIRAVKGIDPVDEAAGVPDRANGAAVFTLRAIVG